MQLNNFKRVEDLREIVFSYLNYAQANISGHRVAAAVVATRMMMITAVGNDSAR